MELISHVAIQPQIMEKVVALKDRMLLDHPKVLLGYEGLKNRRGDVLMIVGAERVADVVEKSTHHVFIGLIRAVRASGCLQ